MQTILAIETSIPEASIAILNNGKLTQHAFESHRKQNQLLFHPLQIILDGLENTAINTILIGTGPGSYSGSRIAIAAAQGIATVHHSQLAGICSFFAIPDLDRSSTMAVGDARRGSYFHYNMSKEDILVKPILETKDDFLQSLDQNSDKSLFTFETQTTLPVDNVSVVRPTARGLIEYWLTLSEEEQAHFYSLPLEPLYLRAPFITKSKKSHPLIGKQL